MKVAILAGGFGTRLQEETSSRPKPMVEIGGEPIIWHIMKIYASHGFKEFVIPLGYKGEMFKNYFLNYRFRANSLSIQLDSGDIQVRGRNCEDWTVHLLDTGLNTQTGGRVKHVAEFIGKETFMLTYGDGVSNVDIGSLLKFHRNHGSLMTVTAVRPPSRFGGISFSDESMVTFEEKPQIGEGWINGGFFVVEPGVADFIEGENTIFEREPMERLAAEGQLMGYRHHEFWQCMDVLRDLKFLENLWQKGQAPWKVWK